MNMHLYDIPIPDNDYRIADLFELIAEDIDLHIIRILKMDDEELGAIAICYLAVVIVRSHRTLRSDFKAAVYSGHARNQLFAIERHFEPPIDGEQAHAA